VRLKTSQGAFSKAAPLAHPGFLGGLRQESRGLQSRSDSGTVTGISDTGFPEGVTMDFRRKHGEDQNALVNTGKILGGPAFPLAFPIFVYILAHCWDSSIF